MIMTDNEILKRVEKYNDYKHFYCDNVAKPLIEHFDKSKLQSCSYDISLDHDIMVYSDEIGEIDLLKAGDIKNSLVNRIIDDNGYVIKPGEYIMCHVKEIINMPMDYMAIILPRTTFNRVGLGLRVQYLNPTYSGKLYLGLKNNSPIAIRIYPRINIGQIIFFKLNELPLVENLYCKKTDSSYQDERDFVFSITKNFGLTTDEYYEALNARIQELNTKLSD